MARIKFVNPAIQKIGAGENFYFESTQILRKKQALNVHFPLFQSSICRPKAGVTRLWNMILVAQIRKTLAILPSEKKKKKESNNGAAPVSLLTLPTAAFTNPLHVHRSAERGLIED